MTISLESKSRSELEALRSNAERVLADARQAKRHAAAREILRNLAAMPKQQPAAGRLRTRPKAVELLAQLAREAAEEFDLAPPEGTPQPHKFTAANGEPKVGGRQRNRVVTVDRYISHRRGDEVASLGWLRRHDEDPETGGGWYIAYTGADSLPPMLPDQDFDAARAAFLARLEAIGTPRRGG
ncbi:hypothetical protein [Falsiroseomonas sp.]|uniref:hypothetical protein n=1 Tax=Falsiroseomonas sp. TaxID=2870721 RepID=UPI003562B519